MKKIVMKLEVHDEKSKQKAMKAVSSIPGIDSISMDMTEGKLTVTGDVDAVVIVRKLRKQWHTDIVTVGPAKEEKKDAGKKDEPKKDAGKNEEEEKKKKEQIELAALLRAYHEDHAYLTRYYHHYHAVSPEDQCSGCIIC